MGLAVTGKLGFTVKGEGTLEDPRLEAHATCPAWRWAENRWATWSWRRTPPTAPSPTT
jgi:hypothetical protein